MKLAWLTDIHLNFLQIEKRKIFYQEIVKTHCDAVLVSGDIGEASSVVDILQEMRDQIAKPIYFVLGNHDYYRGEVNEVRNAVTMLTNAHEQLFWLPASGVQVLDKNTVLVGQDGWADGRLGDYQNSNVGLNDSRMIADLFQKKMLGRQHVLEKMQQLADLDAAQLRNNLLQAVKKQPRKIIVLTHVPPFKESCMHNGQVSGEEWLPYFSSKIIGDVLLQVAEENSTIEFLILCGHTHSEANYQPLSNIIVRVGKAEYYRPEIQEIISI